MYKIAAWGPASRKHPSMVTQRVTEEQAEEHFDFLWQLGCYRRIELTEAQTGRLIKAREQEAPSAPEPAPHNSQDSQNTEAEDADGWRRPIDERVAFLVAQFLNHGTPGLKEALWDVVTQERRHAYNLGYRLAKSEEERAHAKA